MVCQYAKGKSGKWFTKTVFVFYFVVEKNIKKKITIKKVEKNKTTRKVPTNLQRSLLKFWKNKYKNWSTMIKNNDLFRKKFQKNV